MQDQFPLDIPIIKTSASAFSQSRLLASWKASGRSEASFLEARPVPLDDGEESRLTAAGVNIKTHREFLQRAKALLGSARFAELTGDLRERAREAKMNPDYAGAKIRNPTAAATGLILKRIADLPAPPPATVQIVSEPPRPKQPELDLNLAELSGYDKRIFKKIATANAIASKSAEQRDSIAFSAGILVQTLVPYEDPGDVTVWRRVILNREMIMTPGLKRSESGAWGPRGYPYGSIPRLILIMIATSVICTGEQRLRFGSSFYDFAKRLGVSKSGQRLEDCREQLYRLLSASIQFPIDEKRTLSDGRTARVVGIQRPDPIAKNFALGWLEKERASGRNPAHPDNGLFDSYIQLSDSFFEAVRAHGAPFDFDLVRAIAKSPMALDLYTWIVHRLNTLNNSGRSEAVLPWEELWSQFGGTSDVRTFRSRAKHYASEIAALWGQGASALNHSITPEALILKPSRLPVPPNKSLRFNNQ